MPTYTYKARDEAGKMVRGLLKAPSHQEVATKLHRMGYLVTRVEEDFPSALRLRSLSERLRGVKTEQMILFNVQLANLITAGVELLSSLHILEAQIQDKTLKRVIGEVARSVEAGNSFSEALAMHPRLFSRLFVSMVKAGEATGHLDVVLNRYAAYREYQQALQQQISGILLYPAILLSTGISVILLVMGFVVPKFVDVFSKANVPLPLPTRVLNAVGMGVVHHWALVLLAIGALALAFKALSSTQRGAFLIDRIWLKAPIFGPLIREVCISRFARTLATLAASSVPILQALEIVEEVVGNRVIGGAIRRGRSAVEGGARLAEPLRQSGEFPLDTVQMISVGEETGNLDGMLNKISDFYDRGVGYRVRRLTVLIEPVCLLVMGGMVAFIMASLLLPIFDMAKTLRH